MKFTALILISIVAVASAGWLDNLPWKQAEKRRKIIEEDTRDLAAKTIATCKPKSGISDAAIESLRRGSFDSNIDVTSKNFVSCYLDGMAFVQDGRTQVNVIKDCIGSIVGTKNVMGAILTCGNEDGANVLDHTMNVFSCFNQRGANLLV